MKVNYLSSKNIITFLNQLDNNIADLIIADPPYNNCVASWDSFDSFNQYWLFTRKWLNLAIKKLKNTGSIYLFNNSLNSAYVLRYLELKKLIFQNWIVWYKKDGFTAFKKKYNYNHEAILFFSKSMNYTFNYNEIRIPYLSQARMKHASIKGIVKNNKRWFPNKDGKLCTDVWEFSSERLNKKKNGKTMKQLHPTIKPEKLIERIIKASSNKNDLILDLFSGSGTTSFLAQKLNRNYIACENNKEYVEQIKNRLK